MAQIVLISIHAFRRECDVFSERTRVTNADFNPRIPQGMRQLRLCPYHPEALFQSTHSAGNATRRALLMLCLLLISIHAFRRECDYLFPSSIKKGIQFQSTHSAGNATTAHLDCHAVVEISIHAFRRECDRLPQRLQEAEYKFQSTHSAGNATPELTRIQPSDPYFNPRIPQGMRPLPAVEIKSVFLFQSTHSAGNATSHGAGEYDSATISIHAFRRECDKRIM